MAMMETWGWAGPVATKETWAAPAVKTGLESRRGSGNSGAYTGTPSGMNIDTGSHTWSDSSGFGSAVSCGSGSYLGMAWLAFLGKGYEGCC